MSKAASLSFDVRVTLEEGNLKTRTRRVQTLRERSECEVKSSRGDRSGDLRRESGEE